MKKKIFLTILLLFTVLSYSNDKVLKIDFRHRPPEMVIDEDGNFSGPLKDIIERAAKEIGYEVEWRVAPFKRSLEDLKNGKIDIVPRIIETKERKKYIKYFSPIGYQIKKISFLVKKGDEDLIKNYSDLNNLTIGSKSGTVYFDKFDKDNNLNKIISMDDKNLSIMFIKERFDTMIVLDKEPLEEALKNNNYLNYSFAKYKEIKYIKNCYGMSLKSKNKDVYYKLNKKLEEMVKEGLIEKIYNMYSVGFGEYFFAER